jgi:hypothetical protein
VLIGTKRKFVHWLKQLRSSLSFELCSAQLSCAATLALNSIVLLFILFYFWRYLGADREWKWKEESSIIFMIKFILSVASFEAILDGEEALRKIKFA